MNNISNKEVQTAALFVSALAFSDAALLDLGVELMNWADGGAVQGGGAEAGFWILVNPDEDSPIWGFMIYYRELG